MNAAGLFAWSHDSLTRNPETPSASSENCGPIPSGLPARGTVREDANCCPGYGNPGGRLPRMYVALMKRLYEPCVLHPPALFGSTGVARETVPGGDISGR